MTPSPRPGTPDEDATASINYTSGTTARPKGVQLTHRNCWLNAADLRLAHRRSPTATSTCTRCRCSTATAGGCRTRSPRWACRRSWCARSTARRSCAGSSAHGVTLMCGAPAVVAAILDAAGARRAAGEPMPGRGTRSRIVVAGAPPPSKTIERVEAELGWEFIQIYGLTETAPLLTINRRAGRVGRPARAPSGRRLQSRAGRPGGRRAGRRRRRRRGAGPVQPCLRRLLGAAGGVGQGAGGRLVPHRRRGPHRRRRVPGDLGPEEGRDHLRRRERQLDRGRGLPVPAPGGRRGRRDRRPAREVGRDGQGAGRRCARATRSPRPS